eukprot:14400436-Alexandrium_andersonii.AAC.1
MDSTRAQLCRGLFHEWPGGQGIGQGSKGVALVEARGGGDVVAFATGVPPEVSGRLGVPSVE